VLYGREHVHSGRRQDEDLVQEDDSDSVERRRHREPSTTNQYVSNVNISRSLKREEFEEVCIRKEVCTKECKSLRSVCKVPQPFYFRSVDNTLAACSSADSGVWNDVEDRQVHLISNSSDSSSMWSEKFDAECSQADRDCMESSEKKQ